MLNEFRQDAAAPARKTKANEAPATGSDLGKPYTEGNATKEAPATVAKDVMTSEVVTVNPDDTVYDVAQSLIEHGIRGLPVVQGDQLVGFVSDGDLVHRAEIGTSARPRSWWLTLVTPEQKSARDYIKSHAHHVHELMERNVVTVTEDTPLGEVATILETERLERVPVVRNGRLIGIVGRGDIIQKFASQRPVPHEVAGDDAKIRAQINSEIRSHGWTNPVALNITVADGVVDIWGLYRNEADRSGVLVAAENVDGVKEIHDHRSPIRMPYTPYQAE
jgi:CBS domain-containing protein